MPNKKKTPAVTEVSIFEINNEHDTVFNENSQICPDYVYEMLLGGLCDNQIEMEAKQCY